MKKLFFLAIVAVLFTVSVSAQQQYGIPQSDTQTSYYSSVDPCLPCPPCPEPMPKKPAIKKAAAPAGINIENNPINCINIDFPDYPMYSSAPPAKYGSGFWTWPTSWNPNWSWLWPFLFLLVLGIMAYQLWRIANKPNNATNTTAKNVAPPANIPTPPAKVAPIVDASLAHKALETASLKGSTFRYYPDGGFRVDYYPSDVTAPTVKTTKDQTVAPHDA